jgi:hypothetical protein
MLAIGRMHRRQVNSFEKPEWQGLGFAMSAAVRISFHRNEKEE